MIDNNRRKLLISALLTPLATSIPFATAQASHSHSHEMPDMGREMNSVKWMGDEKIALLVYPGMTVLDLVGPHGMFGSLMGAELYIVAKTLDPVTSDAGLVIVPDTTFDTCPKDLTVLFTPGGTEGTLAAATDPDTLAFIADRGERADYITSVCSGSLILGAAGLLEGYQATSHWSCLDALSGFGATPVNERVVRDRNRITGAGVTAGLDFGLTMVAELRGQIYAECTQLMSEYAPQPPFNAGTLATAPEGVKDAMIDLAAGFTQDAEALARRYAS